MSFYIEMGILLILLLLSCFIYAILQPDRKYFLYSAIIISTIILTFVARGKELLIIWIVWFLFLIFLVLVSIISKNIEFRNSRLKIDKDNLRRCLNSISGEKFFSAIAGVYILLLPIIPVSGWIHVVVFNHSFLILNYLRMLNFIFLFPIAIWLIISSRANFFKYKTDLWLFFFCSLLMILSFRNVSVFAGLRQCIYVFLDILLVYFVFSRIVRRVDDLLTLTEPLCFSGIFLSLVGISETIIGMQLLNSFPALQSTDIAEELYRFGFLRADASFSQPLVFGFFLVFLTGIMFLWYNFGSKEKKVSSQYFLLIFALSAVLTFSRTALVGLLILLILNTLFSLFFGKNVSGFVQLASVAVVFLFLTTVLFLISDVGTINYRVNLIDTTLPVLLEHPLIGISKPTNYESVSLPSGSLNVDIVNHFLGTGLSYGIFALISEFAIFLIPLILIFKHHKKGVLELASILFGVFVMCFFTSTVGMIEPIVFISIAILMGLIYEELPDSKRNRTTLFEPNLSSIANSRLLSGMLTAINYGFFINERLVSNVESSYIIFRTRTILSGAFCSIEGSKGVLYRLLSNVAGSK